MGELVGNLVKYQVSELWRYPVKSMAGERLDVAEIATDGIDGDRRWAVRDLETGKLVSAKQPRPWGALLNWEASTALDGSIVVVAPDGHEYLAGDSELNAALTFEFGGPLAMTAVELGREETYASVWPEIPGTALSDMELDLPVAMGTPRASFVDMAALHLVTAESIDYLASLVAETVDGVMLDARRFRPSVVLRATVGEPSEGFADLDWTDVAATLGGATIRISGPAPRCVMTTLGHHDLPRANAVLQTLAAHSQRDTGMGVFACLGTYAEVESSGMLHVGDRFVLGD
jgi:hypothetical protein